MDGSRNHSVARLAYRDPSSPLHILAYWFTSLFPNMTTAAYVAKIIRAELKDRFPATRFTVHSENYSGGDSVSIGFEKGKSAPSDEAILAVVSKYQAGHFDGMTDCYEYTNKTDGPTMRYVFVRSEYPEAVRVAVRSVISPSASPSEWREALDAELEQYEHSRV